MIYGFSLAAFKIFWGVVLVSWNFAVTCRGRFFLIFFHWDLFSFLNSRICVFQQFHTIHRCYLFKYCPPTHVPFYISLEFWLDIRQSFSLYSPLANFFYFSPLPYISGLHIYTSLFAKSYSLLILSLGRFDPSIKICFFFKFAVIYYSVFFAHFLLASLV